MKDYTDIVGKRIGLYDVIECINPKERGVDNIKYKVKCHNCGHEKIVNRMFLFSRKKLNIKTCENCRGLNGKYNLKIGQIYGKYKYLEYSGIKNGFKNKPYKVKCILCGWEGYIGLNVLSASLKSKNNKCTHLTDFKKEGNVINSYPVDNYKKGDIYGTFTIIKELDSIDDKRIFLVECNNCHKESALPMDTIRRSKKRNATHCNKCRIMVVNKLKKSE